MALRKLLFTRTDSPYFKPPPIHICVVAVVEQPRVVSWEFQDTTARPAVTKLNKVAAISDGDSVARVTVFEEYSSKIIAGHSYILRGHTLRGQSPPYILNINKNTMFFRSAPLKISEDLHREGEALLQPASILTPLSSCKNSQGFLTIQGEVVEVSVIKRVQSGRETIPLRNVSLQQDTTQVKVCLWREAAVWRDLQLGAFVRVSHVKAGTSDYGFQLQSTANTRLEQVTTSCNGIIALGVMEDEEDASMLKLLLEGDVVVDIAEDMWRPFEVQLTSGSFKINLQLSGNKVMSIEAAKE